MSCRQLWSRLITSLQPVDAVAALDAVVRLAQAGALDEAQRALAHVHRALMLRRDVAQMEDSETQIECACDYELRECVESLSFSECDALVEHVEKMADAFNWQLEMDAEVPGHARCNIHRHIQYGKLQLSNETSDINEPAEEIEPIAVEMSDDDIEVLYVRSSKQALSYPQTDHHDSTTPTSTSDQRKRKRRDSSPSSEDDKVVKSESIKHSTKSSRQAHLLTDDPSLEDNAVIDRWKRPNKRLVRFQLVASLPEDEQLKEQLRIFNETQRGLEAFRRITIRPRSTPIDLTEGDDIM